MTGKFLTFEGIDGSGKSTQIKLLELELQRRGISTLILRDPGGTKLSEKIRNILLDHKNMILSPPAESLLFVAARAQLMVEKIQPALKQGKFVISDRFSDSTVAYQGYGRGLKVEYLEELNNFATDNIQPDLTIILDVDPESAAMRMESDILDRMEATGIEFFLKVRKGYHNIARRFSLRCVIIDGVQTENEVSELIMKEVNNKLLKELPCS